MIPFNDDAANDRHETLADLSLRLSRLADHITRCEQPAVRAQPGRGNSPADFARHVLQARRRREALFPDLFADPAWDLLLDLFIATEEGRALSVTSACFGTNVPATTALRSIALLERYGLVLRRRHPTDGRCMLLSLSDRALQLMHQWCAEIGASQPSATGRNGAGSGESVA
jgi:hypothetical protein